MHKQSKRVQKKVVSSLQYKAWMCLGVNCYYLVSVCKKIIVGTHGVPDPPSLAQMTFTQCTSMSEFKFDSGAPPGCQIEKYVSFSALFESPTKDMAQKHGSTVKNLTFGFSSKLSGGIPIHVWKPGNKFGPKSQC